MSTAKNTRAKRDREANRAERRAVRMARKDVRRAMRIAGQFDVEPESAWLDAPEPVAGVGRTLPRGLR